MDFDDNCAIAITKRNLGYKDGGIHKVTKKPQEPEIC